MSGGMARLAIAASVATSLGILAAPSVGATPPRCRSSQLTLQFVSFQGATGHRFWQLAFKNQGSTCSLRGFPRVQLLDASRRVIPATVKHEPGPVATVIIGHGKRGHFTFSYTDGGFCNSHFHASRIKAFPPLSAAGFVFNPVPKNHGPIFICKDSGKVSPVRSRPDG